MLSNCCSEKLEAACSWWFWLFWCGFKLKWLKYLVLCSENGSELILIRFKADSTSAEKWSGLCVDCRKLSPLTFEGIIKCYVLSLWVIIWWLCTPSCQFSIGKLLFVWKFWWYSSGVGRFILGSFSLFIDRRSGNTSLCGQDYYYSLRITVVYYTV